MKKLLIMFILIISVCNLAQAKDNSFIGKYSFDLLRNDEFKNVLYSESRVIDDKTDFEKSVELMKDGVSIPSFEINGITYLQSCMPHFCNSTYTIWAFNDDVVYASVIDRKDIKIYGNPPIDIKFNLSNEH